MKKLTREQTAARLREADNVCILTHTRPDGDTLGCAAALCLGLRALGKRACVLENPETTEHMRWLLEGLTVPVPPIGAMLVSVDVAAPNMLPNNAKGLHISLRIDHHGSATSFTDEELVEPGSASCAEVIWELLKLLEVPTRTTIAEALYVGVSTDTGCFCFSNTTEHTFLTAAACKRAGADIYRLNQELFETNTLQRLRMQGWIAENLQFLADGTMAVCAIPRSVELALGVTEDDMANISNFPRSVAGVCVASTLREREEGGCKLSVRAVPGYDATKIAVRFGGGGHKGAAGGSLDMTLTEAAEAVAHAMEEVYR